jgi:hypothetical protein
MLKRYSHVRMQAKREAVKAFSGHKLGGYGTRNGTNLGVDGSDVPISGEKMVGTSRVELLTPTVSR